MSLTFVCRRIAAQIQSKVKLFGNHTILLTLRKFLHELFTNSVPQTCSPLPTEYIIQVISPSFCIIVHFPRSCHSLISCLTQPFILVLFQTGFIPYEYGHMTQLKCLIIFQQVKFESFESDVSLGNFYITQYNITYQLILIHCSLYYRNMQFVSPLDDTTI